MRILLIVDCYLPSTKSSAKLVHDLGVELHRQGHTVFIVAPDEQVPGEYSLTQEAGLTVLRVKSGSIKGASKIVRGWNESRLSSLLWKQGQQFFRDHPCDLIVFYSPSIFFGSLVKRLKKLWHCPSYLILRDIFPQWAVDAGVLKKGPIFWYFRWIELQQYASADVIGVQSPANLRYFQERGWDRRYNLETLYNWSTLHEDEVPVTHYRQQWGLEDQVVFFYGGNIGVAQDMSNIVRLAAALRHDLHVHFLIVGEGSEVPRLEREIAQRSLTNIAIKPAVGQREYLGMLAEFDVGLVTLDRQLQTQNLPGKMLGYMYHRKPILASVNPGNDLKELLETHDAGLAAINGEDALLQHHARQLARDADLRRRLGDNARKLLEEKFAVEKIAHQIVAHAERSPSAE